MTRLADGRDVVTDRWQEGAAYNLYICPGNGRGDAPHSLLAMYADPGVTPFTTRCPEHKALAQSRMTGGDAMQHPGWFPVRIVWRRATEAEMTEADEHAREHYRAGGLAKELVS